MYGVSILHRVSVLKRNVEKFTSHEMCLEWHQIDWKCMFRYSSNQQFSTPSVVHANHQNQMWNDAWLDESFHSISDSNLSPNKLIPNLMDLIIGVDVLQLWINVFAKKTHNHHLHRCCWFLWEWEKCWKLSAMLQFLLLWKRLLVSGGWCQ